MANRTVLARLTVDGVEGVVAGFKKAGSAAVEYGRVSQKAGTAATRWVDKHADDLGRIGGSLLKVGAVGVVALGGLAKSAMDWESAWAGVTKTVDGTPDQLAAIEQGLRDMTKVLPASHEEIAAVAEAAGQLGVETDSILGFTRTMIDLGETTNLTSDEAATALAQLMNVMGTAQGDVSRLGSAVVALGNDGAATEADIVSMAQRIAAAGNQVGLAESDVLGMASALASVGIEAEAGGTAVALTLKQIDGFVREGGEGLQRIAETSGMTAEEFRRAWQDDAAGATASFVEGLGEMQASGEDVNALLGELEISGIRQTDALLRLAGATQAAGSEQDLLREALELGARAWEENTALADEAEKRYQTRAAQAQMAINSIKDEAITLGQELLPVVDSVLSVISDLAQAFGDLDSSTRSGIAGVALIGTAFALSVGSVLKMVSAISGFKVALAGIGVSMRSAVLAMGAIGIGLTVAGVALGSWMREQAEAKARVESLTDAIKQQGTVIGESTRQLAAESLDSAGVLELAEKYGVSLADVTDAALGSADAMERVRESVRESAAAIEDKIAANEAEMASLERQGAMTDEQMARWTELSNINAQLAGELSNRVSGEDELTSAIRENAGATEEAADKARRLAEATGEGADATDASAEASQRDADAKSEQAAALQETAEQMQLLLEATQAYGNELLVLSGSQIGVESSIAGLSEQMEEYRQSIIDTQIEQGKSASFAEGYADRVLATGAALDITTEAGRENQKALDDLARSSMTYIGTLYEQGASSKDIAAATNRARDAWVDGAVALGMAEDKANDLADAYFAIPESRATQVSAPGATDAERQVRDMHAEIDALPAEKQSTVRAILDSGGVEAALAYLARNRIATISVRTVGGRSAPVAGRTVYEAHGGVVDYYANGGLREKHVAQIAPAGAYRVWAEPETGGESYIPLAPSKRARSLDIWRETGRRLGVRGFADGGVVGGSTTYGGTNVGSITVQVQGSTSDAMLEDFARQLPARIAQAGGRR